MAVDMSYRLGWIDESIVERTNNILKQAKLPVTPPEMMTVEMFKSVMAVSRIKIMPVYIETGQFGLYLIDNGSNGSNLFCTL